MVVASLAIAGVITYACMVLLGSSVGFALNLPGIAGVIVAIGITADSFVIYFERIRDEVREGRSLRTAVETGWRRARQTILIADAVSMLSAVILFILAIGSVKGFAFTLGLTTLIDVLVVFMFTKPLVTLLARTKFFGGGHRLSGLDPGAPGGHGTARCSRPAAVGRHGRRAQQRGGGLMSQAQRPDPPALHRRDLLRLHRPPAALVPPVGHPDHASRSSRCWSAAWIFGIEFRGRRGLQGSDQVTAQTVDQMRAALEGTGLPDLDDSIINTIGDDQVRVQTRTAGLDHRGAGGARRRSPKRSASRPTRSRTA